MSGRPLMERLVTDPRLLQHYREQASVILETWFRPEILIPKLRALYAQIRTDLKLEPFPPRRATVPSDTGWGGGDGRAAMRWRRLFGLCQRDRAIRPTHHPATDSHVQPGRTYRYRVYAVLATPHGPRFTGTSNVVTCKFPSLDRP